MDDDQVIQKYLEDQITCIEELKTKSKNTIKNILNILIKARDSDKQVFVIGNGGSASTATHFTSDLLKTSLTENSKRFKTISLSDNIPVLLAWANDSSYENIFVEQLRNFMKKDDILIGISGSGNSVNVVKAVEYANSIGAHTIALTGKGGGKLLNLAMTNLIIPSNDMLGIETMHLLVCHLLTTMIRSRGKPIFSY